MVEKKNNSLVAIIILGVVAVALSVVIWNMGSKLSQISNENRELMKQISNLNSKAETKEDDVNNDNDEVKYIMNEFPKQNDNSVTGDKIGAENLTQKSAHKYTFKYGKYTIVYEIVDGGGDENIITIYDSNKKKVYYNDFVKTAITLEERVLNPAIVSGKLYFLDYKNGECYYDSDLEEKEPYLYYNYIDLTDDNIQVKNIKKLSALSEGKMPICN